QVALPQGLVASGFFSNAFLLDFDEAVCNEFDNWNDDNQWQLVDFCRYVDDMRIVIRLADKSSEMKEEEITQFVSAFLIRHLATHAEGLTLNPEKCETIARIPGYRIMPPSPCAGSWSSGRGLGRAAPAAGPAPAGPRSPVASEPGTPSSASCGSDGCHAPPRWTSRPAAARPKTPAPSPTPAPAAS